MGWPRTTTVFPEPTWWNGDPEPDPNEEYLFTCEKCGTVWNILDEPHEKGLCPECANGEPIEGRES